MLTLKPHERILVALDTTDREQAAELSRVLDGLVGGIKIGKEFFTAHGPAGVRAVVGNLPLFLDLKFHDIPNTVAGAVRASIGLGPLIVNVHASGGEAMMLAAAEAARKAAAATGIRPPKIIAVTVLTSLDDADLTAVGQRPPADEQVLRLATLTRRAGLDGVVCSPREIAMLRRELGPDFLLVVPGIRPDWAARGDQKRIMTPAEALAAGADYLVIGRPITGDPDPAAAARRIGQELKSATA